MPANSLTADYFLWRGQLLWLWMRQDKSPKKKRGGGGGVGKIYGTQKKLSHKPTDQLCVVCRRWHPLTSLCLLSSLLSFSHVSSGGFFSPVCRPGQALGFCGNGKPVSKIWFAPWHIPQIGEIYTRCLYPEILTYFDACGSRSSSQQVSQALREVVIHSNDSVVFSIIWSYIWKIKQIRLAIMIYIYIYF